MLFYLENRVVERTWRLVTGLVILFLLSFDLEVVVLGLGGWLIFEGVTNIRLTKIISHLRWGTGYLDEMEQPVSSVNSPRHINFEAERMLRFGMAAVLILTIQFEPILLWFIPWLVGLMLTSAGLTSICPMLMVFQWLGFKAKYH